MKTYVQIHALNLNFDKIKQNIDRHDPNAFFLLGGVFAYASQEDPQYDTAVDYACSANIHSGEPYDMAAACYRKAIEFGPDHIKARLAITELLFHKKVIYDDSRYQSSYAEMEAHCIAAYTVSEQTKDDQAFGLVCFFLGMICSDLNPKRALTFFRRGARKGNNQSQNHYGLLLVHQNQSVKGKEYFTKSAKQNNCYAFFNLAVLMESKLIDGSETEILGCYKKAAELGIEEAWFILGCLLSEKASYEKNNRLLYQESAECYFQAASKGHIGAVTNYTSLIFQGLAKQSVNDKKELSHWFLLAIGKGDLNAHLNFCIYLFYQKKYDDAQAQLQKLLRNDTQGIYTPDINALLERIEIERIESVLKPTRVAKSSVNDASLTTPMSQRAGLINIVLTPRTTPRSVPAKIGVFEGLVDPLEALLPEELEGSFQKNTSPSLLRALFKVPLIEDQSLVMKTPKVSPLDANIKSKSARLRREISVASEDSVVPFNRGSRQIAPASSQGTGGTTVVETMVVYPHDPELENKIKKDLEKKVEKKIEGVDRRVEELARKFEGFMMQESAKADQTASLPLAAIGGSQPVIPECASARVGAENKPVPTHRELQSTIHAHSQPDLRRPIQPIKVQPNLEGERRKNNHQQTETREQQQAISTGTRYPFNQPSRGVVSVSSLTTRQIEAGINLYDKQPEERRKKEKQQQQVRSTTGSKRTVDEPPRVDVSRSNLLTVPQSFDGTGLGTEGQRFFGSRLFAEIKVQMALHEAIAFFKKSYECSRPLDLPETQSLPLLNSSNSEQPFSDALSTVVGVVYRQLPKQITAFYRDTYKILDPLVNAIKEIFQQAAQVAVYPQRAKFIIFYNSNVTFHSAFKGSDSLMEDLSHFLHYIGHGCYRDSGDKEMITAIPNELSVQLFKMLETLLFQNRRLLRNRKILTLLLSDIEQGEKSIRSLGETICAVTQVVDQIGVNWIDKLVIRGRQETVQQTVQQDVKKISGVLSVLNGSDEVTEQAVDIKRWTRSDILEEMSASWPPLTKYNCYRVMGDNVLDSIFSDHGSLRRYLLKSEDSVLSHLSEAVKYFYDYSDQANDRQPMTLSGDDSNQLLASFISFCGKASDKENDIKYSRFELSAVHDLTLIMRYLILINHELVEQYHQLLWLSFRRSDEVKVSCHDTKKQFSVFFKKCSIGGMSLLDFTQYPLSELDNLPNRAERGRLGATKR